MLIVIVIWAVLMLAYPVLPVVLSGILPPLVFLILSLISNEDSVFSTLWTVFIICGIVGAILSIFFVPQEIFSAKDPVVLYFRFTRMCGLIAAYAVTIVVAIVKVINLIETRARARAATTV
ncbi:MAG: hypothetical protein PHV78_00150 [Patescibacteria group bacterium]|nr:hypothetical protein [Patescibacteria group bacterium]MDD5121411.1 hypothetical protein [Patescibacteria group bacterium]MDD5221863.1 hypothetical protein [Patescibacteria group bacterium]MDD5395670.1 hypothetical protein [Patescibacteria group bacterium]